MRGGPAPGPGDPGRRAGKPLYLRILAGVAVGVLLGQQLGPRAAGLGEAGMLVIRLLKTLATPLIALAVVDALLRTRIPVRQGARLLGISALNAGVALAIGLGVAHLIRGGERWQGRIEAIRGALASSGAPTSATTAPANASLGVLANVSKFVPANIVDPFRENSVISIILLSLLVGAALRAIKDRGDREHVADLKAIEAAVATGFRVLSHVLGWAIELVPFAVFGVVAAVVGSSGAGVFGILGVFLGTMALGLVLHAVVWYSLLLRVAGGISPIRFFRGASDAIVTALSCSSSLATLPVTLRCLDEKLKVSPASARLAACVGTNLNHDGIILYEAAAAIFMLQAFGLPMPVATQLAVALAAVMAGVGIAGVPEAGLITLPLVLGAAGLPDAATAIVIPLVLPVDWILGRMRAAVNVTSDMTVAVLLDRSRRAGT